MFVIKKKLHVRRDNEGLLFTPVFLSCDIFTQSPYTTISIPCRAWGSAALPAVCTFLFCTYFAHFTSCFVSVLTWSLTSDCLLFLDPCSLALFKASERYSLSH